MSIRKTFEVGPAVGRSVLTLRFSWTTMVRSVFGRVVGSLISSDAFVLAITWLLSGKSATTHHGAYSDFEAKYPDIHVQRGARFVEAGTSLQQKPSGIDLALRVVERYFHKETKQETAKMLEC